MKFFFGFENLFQFIFDEQINAYNFKNIEVLSNLSKQYSIYEQDPSEDNYRLTSMYCQMLLGLD